MVPPEHAMWMPAGTRHAVEMLGEVAMRSVYVRPDALASLPAELEVVAMTGLMRSLIVEAVRLAPKPDAWTPCGLIMNSCCMRIPTCRSGRSACRFPPIPGWSRSAAAFVAAARRRMPTIDEWAERLGMSRRSFTRAFHRQTGISRCRHGASRPACSRRCRGWPMASRSPAWRSISAMKASRPSPRCSSACSASRRAAICARSNRSAGQKSGRRRREPLDGLRAGPAIGGVGEGGYKPGCFAYKALPA